MHCRKQQTRRFIVKSYLASLCIQRTWRAIESMSQLREKCRAVAVIQAAFRGRAKTERRALARRDLLRLLEMERAACVIQGFQRSHEDFSTLVNMAQAATVI